MNKKYTFVTILTIFLLLFISAAYAAFNSELNISGDASILTDTVAPTCGEWKLRDSSLSYEEAKSQSTFINPGTNTTWRNKSLTLSVDCSDNMSGAYGCTRDHYDAKVYDSSIKTDSQSVSVVIKDAYNNQRTCTLPVGGSNPYIDMEEPDVTITRSDYNTFSYSITDDLGITGYQITTSSTAPTSGWTVVSNETSINGTYDINTTTPNTYYLWIKDGINVTNKSISSFLVTRSQGTGTTLETRIDGTSSSTGTVVTNNIAVLNNTPVYVSASLENGYESLVLKQNNTNLNASGQQILITEATTISSSATPALESYRVTADANGGTITSTSGWTGTGNTSTKSIAYDSEYGTLPTATRTGYTLDGWYSPSEIRSLPLEYTQVDYIESTGTQYINSQYSPTPNTSIETRFQYTSIENSGQRLFGLSSESINSYKLYYDFFNDSSYFKFYYSVSSRGIRSTGVPIDTNIHDLLLDGYGAQTTLDETTVSFAANTNSFNLDAAMPIFARWYYGQKRIQNYALARIYYMKIYESGALKRDFVPCINDGTGIVGLYDFVDGVFYSNASTTGDDFSTGIQYITDSTIFNEENDKTIYAHWTRNTYTINYNGNGSNGGSTASSNHAYDISKTLTTNGFTRTGYTFTGWNTKADGTGNSYTNGQSVTNLTSTNNGTVTLYAQWIKSTYIVTANANGGSIASTTGWTGDGLFATKTVTHGSEYGTLPTATRPGYTFTGWYKGYYDIPVGYTQVEYIQSTGTQYIDTNYQVTKDTGVEVTYQFNNTTTQQRVFGVQDTSKITYEFYINSSKRWAYASRDGGGQWTSTGIAADANKHTLKFNVDKGYYYISNTTMTIDAAFDIVPTLTESNLNLYLFAENNGGNLYRLSTLKIYEFKIYEGSSLVRHMVPVVQDSTGKAGLYDLVDGIFYGNEATSGDDFTTGEPVTEPVTELITSNELITSSSVVTEEQDHVIIAGWSANQYTLTAHSTGGFIPSTFGWTGTGNTSTKTITYDSAYGTLPAPTRTGYKFDGWYTDEHTLPSGYVQIDYIQANGTQYINTGAQIFNADSHEIYIDFEPTNFYNYNQLYGSTYDGDTFEGWIYKNGTLAVRYNGTRYGTDNTLTVNTRYKVDLIKDGTTLYKYVNNTSYGSGTVSTSSATGTLTLFKSGSDYSKYKLYGAKIYKDGELIRDFIPCINIATGKAGLYDLLNGNFYGNASTSGSDFIAGVDYLSNSKIVNGITNQDIYAHWTANTYSINYNGNGSDSGSTEGSSYIYDVAKPLTTNGFSKVGYTFNGWNTKADGSGTSYTDSQTVTDVSSIDGDNVTLYAQWSINQYTLTFNANGGNVSQETKLVNYGDTYSDLPIPTRSGYTFKGWYADLSVGNDYINYGREYMYTNSLSIHMSAYMNDWSEFGTARLLSSTQTPGGIAIYNDGTDIYDSGVGFKTISPSVTITSLSNGWHDFDLIFDGTYAKEYIDGELVGTSDAFTSGKIGYHVSNSIFIGDEAATSPVYPLGTNNYNGYIGNIIINNNSTLISGTTYNIITAPNQDLTLYARWERDISSLDSILSQTSYIYDGNAKTPYVTIMDGDTALKSGTHYTVDYSNNIDVGTATATITSKTIYNSDTNAFYTGSTTIPYYINNAAITFNKGTCSTSNESSTLYTRKNETVVYTGLRELNNTGTIPSIGRTGYTSLGWYHTSDSRRVLNADGSFTGIAITNITNTDSWDVTSDIILTAQCIPNTYTVSYNGNGNTGGSTASSSHTYNTPKNLTANGFTRDGFNFIGWNTKADGSGTSYSNNQSVTNLTSTNGDTITLYAQWSIKSYSVKVTPVIDGTTYSSGGAYNNEYYTFDVYINNVLQGDNVSEFSTNINHGQVVKVIANNHPGYTITANSVEEKTITGTTYFTPTWTHATASITYRAAVMGSGAFQSSVTGPALAGTTGQSKALDQFQVTGVTISNTTGVVNWRLHQQDYGDMPSSTTYYYYPENVTGQTAKRIEGLTMKLTGQYANYFDIYYRVHVQDQGWLNWTSNDDFTGSQGLCKRVEGIKVKVVPKGTNVTLNECGSGETCKDVSVITSDTANNCPVDDGSGSNTGGSTSTSCTKTSYKNYSAEIAGPSANSGGTSNESRCASYAKAHLHTAYGVTGTYSSSSVTYCSSGYCTCKWKEKYTYTSSC